MPAPSTRHIELLISLTGAPTNTSGPVLSGTRVVGQTLSVTNGSWSGSPDTFAYQFKRDGADIPGAASSSYVAQSADIGHVITCTVAATSIHGTSQPVSSNGLTIASEITGTDVQLWTTSTAGLGGSPGVLVPSPTSVYDSVTNPEAGAGDVEYRAVYLVNTHAVRTIASVVMWIQSQTTSPTTALAIGVAPEPAGSNVTAIANEEIAPSGVTFSEPSSSGTGLSLGALAPGQTRGVWLRRTVNAGTEAMTNPPDTCELGWDWSISS